MYSVSVNVVLMCPPFLVLLKFLDTSANVSFSLTSICLVYDLFWGLTQCDRDYDTIFPNTKWEGRWLYVSTRLPALLELNFFTRLLHLLSAHQALLLCSQALEEKAPSRSDFVTYFSFISPFKTLGLSQLLISPPKGQRKAIVCSQPGSEVR